MMELCAHSKLALIVEKTKSTNFAKYCKEITETPTPMLIKKFSDWFELSSIGIPLLAIDSSYQFWLTAEYLFWWDDCEDYGYLPINDVKLVGDADLDGISASDKDDTCGGFIVDDDITGNERICFIEDMNELINFIIWE